MAEYSVIEEQVRNDIQAFCNRTGINILAEEDPTLKLWHYRVSDTFSSDLTGDALILVGNRLVDHISRVILGTGGSDVYLVNISIKPFENGKHFMEIEIATTKTSEEWTRIRDERKSKSGHNFMYDYFYDVEDLWRECNDATRVVVN